MPVCSSFRRLRFGLHKAWGTGVHAQDEEEEDETLGTASREAMALPGRTSTGRCHLGIFQAPAVELRTCALLAAVEGMPDLPDSRGTAQEEQHGMALATLGPGRTRRGTRVFDGTLHACSVELVRLLGELAIVDDRTRMATAVSWRRLCKALTVSCAALYVSGLPNRMSLR